MQTTNTLTLTQIRRLPSEPYVQVCGLTESGDELLEVDQTILVLVQESEEAGRQRGTVAPAHPGRQCGEQLGELKRVDAVLLQVWQAGVVAVGRRAAGAPVTAGHVFGLRDRGTGGAGGSVHSQSNDR